MLTLALFLVSVLAGDPSTGSGSARAESRAEPAVKPASNDHVRAAIVASVRQKMGSDIDVAVDDLAVQVEPGSSIVEAVPEPGARLDGVIRFILRWSATERSGARVIRSGAAFARLRVTVAHAHAAAIVTRGTALDAANVIEVRHEIASGPLRPWPSVTDAIGSKTLRDLAADACIARGAIVNQPDVRTGQDVVAKTNVDGIEVSAVLVAADSGDAGSVIRVVNHQSRRTLKARVVSPGLVEILK